jgi:hypothetical protein
LAGQERKETGKTGPFMGLEMGHKWYGKLLNMLKLLFTKQHHSTEG